MNDDCSLSAPLRIDRIGQHGAHDAGQSFEHRRQVFRKPKLDARQAG